MKLIIATQRGGVPIAVFEEERHTEDRFHAITSFPGVSSYGRTAEAALEQVTVVLNNELVQRRLFPDDLSKQDT